MVQNEELEMDAHRAALESDVRHLVDKYRAIFGWDVPEVDEALSQQLIVAAMRHALDALAEQDVRTAARSGGSLRPGLHFATPQFRESPDG